jgi:hypothetical protein
MRKVSPGRPSRLHIAFACVLTAAIAWTASSAVAQDDEELEWDTKIMRRFLKDLGLQRDGGSQIEYRERAPLVVPPSRSLPAPRNEAAVGSNPAWPRDPDLKRNQDATSTAAQRAKIKGTAAESAIDEGRPLRPNEMPRGGVATTASTPGTTTTPEDGARPMRPSELGHTKGLWGLLSNVGPEKTESVPFPGEPDRASLTAPPAGYQTPSPAHPYGKTPTKHRSKAADPNDRAVNTSR